MTIETDRDDANHPNITAAEDAEKGPGIVPHPGAIGGVSKPVHKDKLLQWITDVNSEPTSYAVKPSAPRYLQNSGCHP